MCPKLHGHGQSSLADLHEIAVLLGRTALQQLTWEDEGRGPQLVQISEPLELRSVHNRNTCGALQQQVGCDVKEQAGANPLQTHACR